jgi:SAM-dependent methyltransferase
MKRSKPMSFASFITIRDLKNSPMEVLHRLDGEDANAVYRAGLAIQNELYVGSTLRYLETRSEWLKAETVLDLGCGPGDLIHDLCRSYPDKSYTGVDMNQDFIATAGEQARGSSLCRFIQADLHEFSEGRYDFIILRAVLQHLKDADRLMRHLPELVHGKGVVLFLDTTRENFVEAEPPIAAWNDFYRRLEAAQKEHTGSRDCIAELEARLPGTVFQRLESLAPLIAVSGAQDRKKVVQYLILACAIATRMMSLPLDLNALIADLIRWHDTKNSRLALKSRLLLIKNT